MLQAELPGMDTKDVDVRVENNTLTLSGERKRVGEVKEDSYHRVERCYGSFTRSFTTFFIEYFPDHIFTTILFSNIKYCTYNCTNHSV